MSTTSPSWSDLYAVAEAQAGHFTTKQADEAGYSPQLLQKYLANGRVVRRMRGIYRLVHFPSTDLEDLVVAWLWGDQQGVFSHDTALFLHELSDVMPDKLFMTLPERWAKRRVRVPHGVIPRYADLTPTDRVWHGPVPLTSPLRTLADAVADHLSPEHIERAVRDGLARGLFGEDDVQAIAPQLADPESRAAAESLFTP